MHERYRSSLIDRLWSAQVTYKFWVDVECAVATAQAMAGMIPQSAATEMNNSRIQISWTHDSIAKDIQKREMITGHDVAAFLQWFRSNLSLESSKWLHFGLTSSDIVDTADSMRMKHSLYSSNDGVEAEFRGLRGVLRKLCTQPHTPILGRTHGQPAEPTSLMIKSEEWLGMVDRATSRLHRAYSSLFICKLSGPVGTFAHNSPMIELAVAKKLGLLAPGAGNSQIIPRDRLAHWASCAAGVVNVCAKIAMDFRVMSTHGEVKEGWESGHVGSSSMPHKNNPITAEQITGMSRLAQGYAQMLQPIDLWAERDMSHSCVERVAVPDLLHVLLHTMKQTTRLIENAVWMPARMRSNLADAGSAPYSARTAVDAIRNGEAETREEAELKALSSDVGIPDLDWYFRNYPS